MTMGSRDLQSQQTQEWTTRDYDAEFASHTSNAQAVK